MSSREGRRRQGLDPRWMRWLLIVAFFVAVELLTRLGHVSPAILVPPSQMLAGLWEALRGGQLLGDFKQTVWELLASAALATVIGLPLGMLFWKLPLFGRMCEPYLVGLYAVPLVLFYPFMLVILGLGPLPVIAVAAAMGLIPIALNSWIGFREIPEIYFKVAQVCGCKGWSQLRKVTLPAAAPLIFAGLKLGIVYCFIGVVAMEFITASAGMGFRVAYNYDAFKAVEMYAYVLAILVISAAISVLLRRGEHNTAGGLGQ